MVVPLKVMPSRACHAFRQERFPAEEVGLRERVEVAPPSGPMPFVTVRVVLRAVARP